MNIEVDKIVEFVAHFMVFAIILITLPLWIVPYLIYKGYDLKEPPR